jgi:hypothetical protein
MFSTLFKAIALELPRTLAVDVKPKCPRASVKAALDLVFDFIRGDRFVAQGTELASPAATPQAQDF